MAEVADNPVLSLSAAASLSAATRVAREGEGAGGGVKDDKSGGRSLLERSEADAPECEFTIQDLEELDDLNDYSDEEEEDEEDDDEEDDDELPSTDDESQSRQHQQQRSLKGKPGR